MKTLNKLGLLGVFATACALPLSTKALATSLPEADANGVVTLTEDVDLQSALVLGGNSNIKVIDLAGHTLRRPGYYGYLINNSSEVTIKNGNIVCEEEDDIKNGTKPVKSSSSCIRNNGSLTVDNVKVDAFWTALKVEEGQNLTIKNGSEITSRDGSAGAIMNYGNTTVEDSTITGAKDPNGTAIFTMSIYYGGKAYEANVNVKNSTLNAYWPVLLGKYDEISEEKGLANNVTLEGKNTILTNNSKILRKDVARDDAVLSISGEITAPIAALEYMEDGTKLILNQDLKEEVTVPTGMTLVVPAGVSVTDGKIVFEEGARIENKSGAEILVYTVFDGEEKTVKLANNSAVSKYEEEKPSEPTNPEDPKDPVEPNEPTDPSEPEEPVDNPQTFDGVAVYASLAAISVGGLGLVLKKHLN